MIDYAPEDLWRFLPIGYLLTVLVEGTILWFGLSPHHPPRRRLTAALWLTACTYPIVVLVLPSAMAGFVREDYLIVAETFAPAAECLLFWLAFGATSPDGRQTVVVRDYAAIIAANLASFAAGESTAIRRLIELLIGAD